MDYSKYYDYWKVNTCNYTEKNFKDDNVTNNIEDYDIIPIFYFLLNKEPYVRL